MQIILENVLLLIHINLNYNSNLKRAKINWLLLIVSGFNSNSVNQCVVPYKCEKHIWMKFRDVTSWQEFTTLHNTLYEKLLFCCVIETLLHFYFWWSGVIRAIITSAIHENFSSFQTMCSYRSHFSNNMAIIHSMTYRIVLASCFISLIFFILFIFFDENPFDWSCKLQCVISEQFFVKLFRKSR
jgi:hypothetical protein